MLWRVRADNFFYTTLDALINNTDSTGTIDISDKTVDWYTLEDWDYMFWMVVWLNNPTEKEIFRITNVTWTVLTYDKRISPNGLFNHIVGDLINMQVSSDFTNYISNNVDDFWLCETISWAWNELKVLVRGWRVVDTANTDISVADTSLTLPISQTNYIYFDDGDTSFKATTTEPTAYYVVAKVVTWITAVTSIEDYRSKLIWVGLVPMSLTETQRNALTGVRNGTTIFNTTSWLPEYYSWGSWFQISSGTATPRITETVEWKGSYTTDAEFNALTDTRPVSLDALIPKPSQAWRQASESQRWQIELADAAEALAWVDDTKAMTPKKVMDVIDTNNISIDITHKNIELWETISNQKIVSLMADGKIYKLLGNKRTLNSWVTGHTSVVSIKLSDTKIITVWLTTNTITLYVWIINLATNAITYWAWTTVDTNAVSIRICKVNTDKVFVMYWKTWTYTSVVWRVVDVSWTPSVWAETTLIAYHSTYSVAIWHCSYLASDKVVITFWYPSWASTEDEKVLVCTISWTTISAVWTALQIVGNTWGNESFTIAYIADNRFALVYSSWASSGSVSMWLYSVSWTTITALSAVWLSGWTPYVAYWILYDWVYVYASWWNWIHRCSISWDTLTKDFSTACTPWYICKIWNLIWLVSWTSLVRYSDWWSSFVQRNTIDYWISLVNIFENVYSNNYIFITVSWNPAPIYKIGNETRWIVGYLPTGWAKDATGTVTMEGGIIYWLSNIIPWEVYYVTFSSGAIWLTGDTVLWRWISTTEIKLSISYIG